MDRGQKVVALDIGTGFAVGIVATLFRPGLMHTAPFTEPVIGEKDAGTVLAGFEGVFALHVPLADLAVGNTEMPGQAVDIVGHDIERGPLEPVAAVAGTVVTVDLVLIGT